MEEFVGQIWDRWITRAAHPGHREAAVSLDQVRRSAGIWFRAFGGDPGLQVEAATATRHGARRRWLQRVAGTNRHVELCWQDDRALRLPAQVDLFPETHLNRGLYTWLAALAANEGPVDGDWFTSSQRLTRRVLDRFPGLGPLYYRLVDAQIALRPAPAALDRDSAERERAIQEALRNPGSVDVLPSARGEAHPVHLWLHPAPPRPQSPDARSGGEGAEVDEPGGSRRSADERRRKAERVDMPDGKGGLILFRMESLFSWAEFVKVDRTTEDDDDPGADNAAEDMEVISVARDQTTVSKRLRFDLDLPAPDNDDLYLGEGIPLPEWDHRRGCMRPDYCRLQPMVAADAPPVPLPAHLRTAARRLRSQFEALKPSRVWFTGQPEGTEPDMEAYLRFRAEREAGLPTGDMGLYRDFRGGSRDLACLLLADLSMSTDAWVSNSARVVDVIRDSLFLFAEALSATGDRFAMYGFSSRNRDHVRFNTLKAFDEHYDETVRGRVQAMRPGYYTRMGAAIRHATSLLAAQPLTQRLLLLLTDGKPNDLDQYEGRYGIEDTRMAILEARRQGLHPFCVTIDEQANDYLPHLFGSGGYILIHKPAELPRELPLLYARLTG